MCVVFIVPDGSAPSVVNVCADEKRVAVCPQMERARILLEHAHERASRENIIELEKARQRRLLLMKLRQRKTTKRVTSAGGPGED